MNSVKKSLCANLNIRKNSLIPQILISCALSLTLTAPGLAQTPPRNNPQVSAQIQKLESGTAREKQIAVDRLVKLGKDAVPELIKAVEHKNPQVRLYAIRALEKIGGDAGSAVPVLSRALKDSDRSVRQAAAQAFERVGKAALVPYLIRGLQNEDVRVRYNSAHSLSRLGKNAIPAVPHLIKTLEDENAWVRLTAAYALGGIGVDAAPAMSPLITTLKDPDDSVRHSAAYAIGNIGLGLSEQGSKLSTSDLDKTIAYMETALKMISTPNPQFRPQAIESIQTPLNTLKQEKSIRLRRSQIEKLLAILSNNRLLARNADMGE